MSKPAERDTIIAQLVGLLGERRRKMKLSLMEVAARAGLDHTMILRVEKGERLPTIGTLLRIADALETELWPLLKVATERVRPKKR